MHKETKLSRIKVQFKAFRLLIVLYTFEFYVKVTFIKFLINNFERASKVSTMTSRFSLNQFFKEITTYSRAIMASANLNHSVGIFFFFFLFTSPLFILHMTFHRNRNTAEYTRYYIISLRQRSYEDAGTDLDVERDRVLVIGTDS